MVASGGSPSTKSVTPPPGGAAPGIDTVCVVPDTPPLLLLFPCPIETSDLIPVPEEDDEAAAATEEEEEDEDDGCDPWLDAPTTDVKPPATLLPLPPSPTTTTPDWDCAIDGGMMGLLADCWGCVWEKSMKMPWD